MVSKRGIPATPDEERAIAETYAAGYSVAATARAHGRSETLVSRVIREYGIARPVGRQPVPVDLPELGSFDGLPEGRWVPNGRGIRVFRVKATGLPLDRSDAA